MKKPAVLVAVSALSLFFAAQVPAEQSTSPSYSTTSSSTSAQSGTQSGTQSGAQSSGQQSAQQSGANGPTSQYLSKSSELIGKPVVNPQGEKLGKIDELVIDTLNGRVAYAVLDSSGVQGMGDKLFAVPMAAIQPQNNGQQLVLNVSKDKMAQAPGFERSQWPDMANPQWGTQVYLFYGVEPYAAIVTQHPVIGSQQGGTASSSTMQGGLQQPGAQGSQTVQGTTGPGSTGPGVQSGNGQQTR